MTPAHRLVSAGPGFTITEPAPGDPYARWRPILDNLSPADRRRAEDALLFASSDREGDRVVAGFAAGARYTDAAFRVEEG